MELINISLLPVFAYLLGSVPWGVILTRLFIGEDITRKGSGNIGATNVRRVAGTIPGVLTLAGDVLKGTIPVYFAIFITDFNIESNGNGWEQYYISFVAISAFWGHLYPVFTKFGKGGKGIATAGGCFLVISPLALLAALLVFILFVCCFRRVSLASLAAVTTLPLVVWIFTQALVLAGCAVMIAIFVFFRHKENIRRLREGTEPKI